MNRKKEADIDYRTWTQEQFEEDMRTNPKYTAFFAPYGKTWVDGFMKEHAAYRFKALAQLERNQKDRDYPYKEIETMAHQFLDEILEKKLFNVQCLWRAGQIDLPHIRQTADFHFLSKNLRNCPFIEPITEEELAIGIQFLKEQPYWTHYSFIPWQNYDIFKDNIGEEDEETWNPNLYPMFYAHFDLYEKTGYFSNLPDIRGEIENNYRAIGYEAKQKLENPPEEAEEVQFLRHLGEALGKRYLFYDRYTQRDFVEACEDDQIKEALDMDENYLSYHLEDIDFEAAMLFLTRMDEPVPMIAHEDWRTAIKESVIFFKNRKMIEVLPRVYKDYIKEYAGETPKQLVARRTAAFDPTEMLNDWIHQYIKELIVLGRRTLGEPENLDYVDEL